MSNSNERYDGTIEDNTNFSAVNDTEEIYGEETDSKQKQNDEYPLVVKLGHVISEQPVTDTEETHDKKSLFSCSSSMTFSPYSSLDSFTTSSQDTSSTAILLSRRESQSTLDSRNDFTTERHTVLVHLTAEEQIQRDAATEEQLARVRKEIEEMEVRAATSAYSNELKRRKSRKDLVKVPIESSLPVALHSKETGKEGESEEYETDELHLVAEPAEQQLSGLRIVDEDHRNYILMYDMLTGIRISVSRCQAKPTRPLTPDDFYATHKMAFDLTGNEETPSSRYDFKFKDYAPWVFRSLREQFSIDAADYLVSLTGKYVLSELYSPGKSGSLFYYSQDYRFIIKTIRESEHLFLRKILPRYHQHVTEQPDTLLVRFFGLHRMQLPKGKKIYFVVMGNLFPNDRPMRSIYDLKVSWKDEIIMYLHTCVYIFRDRLMVDGTRNPIQFRHHPKLPLLPTKIKRDPAR